MTEQPILIHLDRLILTTDYQPRVESLGGEPFSEKHVQALMKSDPSQWPPIIVTPVDESASKYYILDGAHRAVAASRLGLGQILCIARRDVGYPESFDLNRQHGLPLSVADRLAYAEWMRDEYRDSISFREIARRCGLSAPTVTRHLKRIDQDVNPVEKPVSRANFNPLFRQVLTLYKRNAFQPRLLADAINNHPQRKELIPALFYLRDLLIKITPQGR